MLRKGACLTELPNTKVRMHWKEMNREAMTHCWMCNKCTAPRWAGGLAGPRLWQLNYNSSRGTAKTSITPFKLHPIKLHHSCLLLPPRYPAVWAAHLLVVAVAVPVPQHRLVVRGEAAVVGERLAGGPVAGSVAVIACEVVFGGGICEGGVGGPRFPPSRHQTCPPLPVSPTHLK
jgi:hypothetical protein